MEFNQSRITVTDTALMPILDWIIAEWQPGCKVVSFEARELVVLESRQTSRW
jgi:hypothetical protein